ncbi:hypothetical protein BDV41DRAFT_541073 [Aspergillus transmontanensis]|uniref:Uncharacterized protein n=1 Tax=Aspergillus transmontanensis TaxID=1034304 RepID=A0A5N6VSX5_9EURO|nr:hypothetical protein BDV41DRAFT_541073 [Aspergillus transmontanensis]
MRNDVLTVRLHRNDQPLWMVVYISCPAVLVFADDGLAEVIGDSLVSMLDVYDDGICGGGIHSRTRPGAGI